MHNIFNNIVSKMFPTCFDALRHHLQGVLLLYQNHMPELAEDTLKHRTMYEILDTIVLNLLCICWLYVANICKMQSTHIFNMRFVFSSVVSSEIIRVYVSIN
jgi:hypothetical protein